MPSVSRDLCNAILRAIVMNPILAGICIAIPTYFLMSAFIQTTSMGQFYTLLAVTILCSVFNI
jgi:hypothetical protein